MEKQNNNIMELEQLREQVALFKNRLEEQEIISNRLLCETTKRRISWIKKINVGSGIVGFLLLPVLVVMLRFSGGCSWIPIVAISLCLISESIFNIWNASTISAKHLSADSLVTMRHKLLTFKKRELWAMSIDMPLATFCILWICIEIIHVVNHPNVIYIGVPLGLCFAAFINYREIRSLNRALKQIDEFI